MGEIKTPLQQLEEGKTYTAGPEEYIIKEYNTVSDVIRFIINSSSIEDVAYCLKEIKDEKKQYSGATCRGCFILGTACGTCEKCMDELKTIRLKEEKDQKELGIKRMWLVQKIEINTNNYECDLEDLELAIYSPNGIHVYNSSHVDLIPSYRVAIHKGSDDELRRVWISPPIKKESHKDIMARRPKTEHYNTMEEFFDKYCAWEEDLKAVEEEI